MADIVGTSGDDVIDGTELDDDIDGAEGNDEIFGLGGNDRINGGLGNDTLHGGDGNDTLDAFLGRDFLYGDDGDDYLTAALEPPLDVGGGDWGFEPGTIHVTTMYGGAGNDTLIGQPTGPSSNSGLRQTYMFGGTGDDVYYARFSDQTGIFENANEGYDTVILLYRELPGEDRVFYMPANVESLAGALGTRMVDGVRVGATLIGNELDNTIVTAQEIGGVITPTGDMVVLAGAGNDTVNTDAGNDIVFGEDGDDFLNGFGGVDTLIGGAGDDQLDMAWFADQPTSPDALYGGTGNDVYGVDHVGDIVFEFADEGEDTVYVRINNGGWYAFDNIENIYAWSSTESVTFLVGNGSDNQIFGQSGGELLLGGGGNDFIFGYAGNDLIFGEDGNDTLNGGAGIDYLVGGAGNDGLYGGDGADALYGQDGDDVVDGGEGFFTDILVGGDGDDQLLGNSGLGDYDLMDGGAGNDSYYVDTPDDLTFEAVDGGIDTVYARIDGAGYYLWANTENLYVMGDTPFGVGNELNNMINGLSGNASANAAYLGGAGDDFIIANAGNNALWGESGDDLLDGLAGNDLLVGGDGDDVLIGGAGDDIMMGGAGADVFHVYVGDQSIDYVLDFEQGVDRIEQPLYNTFAAAMQHVYIVGNDTVFEHSTGSYFVLQNFTGTLTPADFGFV